MAFEYGGITMPSAQNTRALIPFVLIHCAIGLPSYVRDRTFAAVQIVPILKVL